MRDEANGATAAGGGTPDTAGHTPPSEEIVLGCARPLWGKFWTGGLRIGGWADEEDDVGTERSTVEADCAAIAECWLLPEFRCVEPVAQPAFLDEVLVASFVTEISVADMGGIDDIVADPVATEIFAKRASEDIGALGDCTGTLQAKSGHIFKDDRTASRFSSLFADLGDYDDLTTPGGAQLDKLGSGPYMMTPVLDTG